MSYTKRSMPLVLLALLMLMPVTGRCEEFFQQSADYTIRVRLDTKAQMLYGAERINYTNNSPDTLTEFYLHLYPNAFRSKQTKFMKDYAKRFNYTFIDLPKKYRSWLRISDVTVDGNAVNPRIDDTIARINLPKPLTPGGTIEVSLKFEEKIPRQIGRSGYRSGHYDMAQWYPKVAVYDEHGFDAEPLRYPGEYYGEFGNFDVYLEVPDNYVVAATGELWDGDAGWTGTNTGSRKKDAQTFKTLHFHAENVHDFAWSASRKFIVDSTESNGVDIRSFYYPKNRDWKDSTLVYGVRAVDWLAERVGLYPYPQLSIVQGLLSGGMEYPMLVMNGSVSESLMLHEVGHIYFYGALGNNERADAWLDEGLTTFQTGWYLTERYGEYGKRSDWNWYQRITPQYSLLAAQRRWVTSLMREGYGERLSNRAEEFKHDYTAMVYGKASLMFAALRYVVGDEAWESILKTYYDEWKFKHVNEERFRTVCEEVSGMDLGWFFDQWVYTRKICDYKLDKMKTRVNATGDGYQTQIVIKRVGEITMPLQLELTFRDGSKQTIEIPGRLRTIEKTFNFPEKPKRAALNPKNEILDVHMADNFIPRRNSLQIDWPNNHYYPEHAYQIRWHPFVWYNDVDEYRVGLSTKGSYTNWGRRFNLAVYYGIESGRFDYLLSYQRFSKIFGHNTMAKVRAYKLEGRNHFTFDWTYHRQKQLSRPPKHEFSAGITYNELTDPRYIANPEVYQTGPDVVPFFRYVVDPQFDLFRSRFDTSLRFGRKWFGGDYDYSRFESTAAFKARRQLIPADINLRLFLGLIGGSMPYQEKFYLASGGPRARDDVFFLRSSGAIPDDLNYHEPGHGNLRGYLPGEFGVNGLFATNFELGGDIPLLSSSRKKFLGQIKTYAFIDAGWSTDEDNPIGTSDRVQNLVDNGALNGSIVDAGIGFTLARDLPFWKMTLRLDLPLYLNKPEINGETKETDYRYVFSLKTSF
ncbi:MAG: M1 family metallopeptidase [Candidatus Latescibacterota bacterium]|nr:MAG: M1 family metallopeptidase [Candidatus Latescibacterota bacterium]